MKKFLLAVVLGAVLGTIAAFAQAVFAQAAVTQGGTQNIADWYVTSGAHRVCTFTEFLVTNAAGGSTLTAQAGRKAVELQNLGPNVIYCRLDGGTPTASSAGGRQIAASGVGVWAIDVSSAVSVKCIAATAAQVTTAATAVTQCR